MTIWELYDKHYNDLTDFAKGVIETSDGDASEWFGKFDNAGDFNEFCEKYLKDE